MKKSMLRQLLSVLLLVSLAGGLTGCKQTVATKELGDDYFGRITVPEDWVVVADGSIQDVNGSDSSDATRKIDYISFGSVNEEVSINIVVDRYAFLRERIPEKEAISTMMVNYDVRTVSLAGGKISPVYRITYALSYDDSYAIEYRFVGSDGLMRVISVQSANKGLHEESLAIIEETYSLSENLPAANIPAFGGIEQQLLLSQDEVQVHLLRYSETLAGDPSQGEQVLLPILTIWLENNSKRDVYLRCEMATVNGFEVEMGDSGLGLGIAVAGESLANGFVMAPKAYTDMVSGVKTPITSVETLQFQLSVYDLESDEMIASTDVIEIKVTPTTK